MLTYKFETDDPGVAAKIFAALGSAVGVAATAGHTLVVPGAVPPAALPQPAVAPAPFAAAMPQPAAAVPFAAPMPASTAPAPAPAPAPVAAAPAPAPAAAPGAAPPGWTVGHIAAAAKAHADVHGPASLKAIVNAFGAKKASDIDPARWPEAYNQLVAGTTMPAAS